MAFGIEIIKQIIQQACKHVDFCCEVRHHGARLTRSQSPEATAGSCIGSALEVPCKHQLWLLALVKAGLLIVIYIYNLHPRNQ